jgi:hypothetical protein
VRELVSSEDADGVDDMNSPTVYRTASGVQLATDFRDNLIIDKYDPIFSGMKASKRSCMRSENSEDVVTWNVFRSLRHVDPVCWLPLLAKIAGFILDARNANLYVWKSVKPPPSLIVELDEGSSEIDVVIEGPCWVWFIEAKFQSDISSKTTNRPERNQVLRNIDVGSYYAGVRDFYFSLLVASDSRSPMGCKAVQEYKTLIEPRRLLAGHRPDGLHNLKSVSCLTWNDLGKVLASARDASLREDEKCIADRALKWLQAKNLAK